MFSITKLGQVSQAFVAEMSMNNKSRSLQSSLALAKVLTFNATLPSSPVGDAVSFYRTHVQLEAETKVNSINEIMVLDVKVVMDFCMKLYMLRYQSAHPSCHVFSFNKETAVEDFFGISRAVDPATITVIKGDPATLAGYVNKYKTMTDELFTEERQTSEGVVA